MKAVLKNAAFVTLAWSMLLVFDTHFTKALACDYYASPSGTGNGLSPSSPFQVAKFWAVARPGKTLCLLDGVYTGSSSMINPPSGLNGTASEKITIKALNDGQVRINGGHAGIPIRLSNNDHFIIEGVNAHRGQQNVVYVTTGSDNNLLRRIVAWDSDTNTNSCVFGSNNATNITFEDVAGFGTGRRIMCAYRSTGITYRRAWALWSEVALTNGPQTPYQCCYHSTRDLFENVIGTTDWTGAGSSNFNGGAIGFSVGGEGANHRLLGSIFYTLSSQNVSNQNSLVYTDWGATDPHGPWTIKDVVAYTEQAKRPFNIFAACTNCFINNTTEIGGNNSNIGSAWTQTNRKDYSTISAMNSDNAKPFQATAGNGARVCFRYQNGTLTSTPLWPWPMNQRIIDAMRAASKTPVDVTRTMEAIFGPIPSECRGAGVASAAPVPALPSVPTSPASLRAQ
jgi:hypothetical protein